MGETFGKYTFLERLGYGGMAEVFLAKTAGVGGFEKLLAIKRLLPYCLEDQQTVDLLADEARITVQLTHPNIVQVFDFGRVDDSYFMAMEYVDGLDLRSLLEDEDESHRPPPLPLAVSLFIAISVLDGLDFAHRRRDATGEALGIIHRDVTPHNVLISRHGQVKLTDFGVARARISIHVSMVGDIRGKFSYMPPEQACGGEIDHRVDIFAMGAILYEILAGTPAFRSASSGEQMKLLTAPVAPPSRFNPEVSARLDQIVMQALAKDPAARFAEAGEIATALRRELQEISDPVSAQRDLGALVEARLERVAGTEPVEDFPLLSRAEHEWKRGGSLILGAASGELVSSQRLETVVGPEPTGAAHGSLVEVAYDQLRSTRPGAAIAAGRGVNAPIAFAETVALDRSFGLHELETRSSSLEEAEGPAAEADTTRSPALVDEDEEELATVVEANGPIRRSSQQRRQQEARPEPSRAEPERHPLESAALFPPRGLPYDSSEDTQVVRQALDSQECPTRELSLPGAPFVGARREEPNGERIGHGYPRRDAQGEPYKHGEQRRADSEHGNQGAVSHQAARQQAARQEVALRDGTLGEQGRSSTPVARQRRASSRLDSPQKAPRLGPEQVAAQREEASSAVLDDAQWTRPTRPSSRTQIPRAQATQRDASASAIDYASGNLEAEDDGGLDDQEHPMVHWVILGLAALIGLLIAVLVATC